MTEQEMRTKVIKEMECCVSLTSNGPKCTNCDYADEFHNGDCETYLLSDALALLKEHEQATIEPKRIDLTDETKAWLDKLSAVDALRNIADICMDWDGYRTANGLGGLVNEIWAYARYCADRLQKAQKPREITKEEWEQWKKTPDGKRDPLYFMWVDCAPGCWAMRPEDIHESAYLIGEIKIWNKKPSHDIMMQAQRDTCSMGMIDVARIMTRRELENQGSDTLYLEFVDRLNVMKVKICQIESHKKLFRTQVLCCFCTFDEYGQIQADFKYMGKLWRCWTDYPDQAAREAIPWKN